ncbi:hypothetical protein TPA0910_86920 [Streptomyces hygroscopicus subsp. sporocinereus]|uniref:Uncharacterized protein n=1 Tax=Streptomyces hygroscopicus TaxID=1912 RepID=A0ABQ3UFC3_STRHY|nr:hypothetical protein [Streptomyces hygroscopicus]GHJ34259.1 hypothetical protein TPA0910_86920 [Streptomyces hygroscopicus]
MQTSRPARSVTSIRPRPTAPAPRWEGLFLEPAYADGLPYETTVGAPDAEDDLETAA